MLNNILKKIVLSHPEYKRVLELAHIDPLTSLLNRNGLEDWLDIYYGRKDNHERPAMLIAIDLKSFKDLNYAFGQNGGDECMIKISKGLRSITRNEDCLARVGGDEFVIILADWMNLEYGDDSKFREDFSKKLLKLGKELADDFRDSGHSTYRHLTVLDYGFAYLSKKHDFKDAYARADRNSKRMKEINDLSLVKI